MFARQTIELMNLMMGYVCLYWGRGISLSRAIRIIKTFSAICILVLLGCSSRIFAAQSIEEVLLRESDKNVYLQYSNDISDSDAYENRNQLANIIIEEGEQKSTWEILHLHEADISKYVGETVAIWHFDDTSVAPYPLRLVYMSFNESYNVTVYITFDIDDITKGTIDISSFSNGNLENDMHFSADAVINPTVFNIDDINFKIKGDHGFSTDQDAEEASKIVLSVALDEFETYLSENTGYHLADLGWFSGSDTRDVQDKVDGERSRYNCAVDGCKKEGTITINGLSGVKEYYCEDHYREMEEILSQMISDSDGNTEGYSYDSDDPYYSANDHNHDGKISEDEFQDAMGNLLDDLGGVVSN